MIPKECKRLAEVDFPIAVVSKHAAREKSIRHGHPSTLHLWWARRPLASCRAMLLALLLPDPCDPYCPEDFKKQARELLPRVQGKVGPENEDLRKALLHFIGEFSNWDLSSDRTFLEVGRGLVKAAHPEQTPLVVDPFAGGGSIPLEALRLGCEAFASDLNPVACLILKVMLEDIPGHSPQLADELRRVGKEIREAAEKELAEFYPPDSDGSRPIAYLWARTVRCEAPNCGAEIPLFRTIWLAKRFNKNRRVYTKLISLEIEGDKQRKTVESKIINHNVPAKQLPLSSEPTIKNGKATCPCCKKTLSDARVRAQLREQQGGSDPIFNEKGERIAGARLMVVILRKKEPREILFRLPNKTDLIAAKVCIEKVAQHGKDSFSFPSEPLSPIRPSPNARGVSGATRIGITDFGRLFTARQKLALKVLLMKASAQNVDFSVKRLLSLAITKQAERCSSFVTWINSTEAPRGTFARQALTIAWDFLELVPIADNDEFIDLIGAMAEVVENIKEAGIASGQVEQASATISQLPNQSANLWFTDPPYYDSIPYADLSDFFFVWLKRMPSLPEFMMKLTQKTEGGLTPKLEECTWNQAHFINGMGKTPDFFESTVASAFKEGGKVISPNGLGCVVFAHKSTEGWEALLSGMMKAGWVIVASWPIATERRARLNAKESAALATSVHLVCRPRPENSPVADWGEVWRELPGRVGNWMERLQLEGIRGADLVFACIGPALEIYSRYSKVVDADDREIPLGGDPEASEPHRRGFLAYVWEAVGRTALEQVLGTAEAKARNGASGAVEEDARLTALFLWTLQSTNGNGAVSESEETGEDEADDEESARKKKKPGFSLIFDVVRRFAQPLGIHLPEWEGRIIETEKGVVRLLSLAERASQLFGEGGAQAVADKLERSRETSAQLLLFPQGTKDSAPKIKGRGRRKKSAGEVSDESLRAQRGATTLDRVHAAMLLQASGRANALRALLKEELDRGPDFLRLANALSALYPKDSEEKRLLDAMLLAMPR